MNTRLLSKVAASIALLMLLGVIIKDSAFHFDAQRVETKREHYSAQRNWNSHYGQENVFNDSSIRYAVDFSGIKDVVKPNSVLLSDLATSYYAAAELPVYVVNLHRHQSRSVPYAWKRFIEKRAMCYMEFAENREKVFAFFQSKNKPDYVLVNKDRVNSNRKRDCLAFRSQTIIKELPRFADLLWEGEYLNLYSVN